jgi:outer membrane protein
MKKLIQSLSLLAIVGAGMLSTQAQEAAPKIFVADLGKILTSHYEFKAQMAKWQSDEQKAQAQLDEMKRDRDALIAQLKDLKDEATNPMATADAKAKAQDDAQAKAQEIQGVTDQANQFIQDTQRSLQARRQNVQATLLEQISKIATEIAKSKGGTLVLDKNLPVIYSDPSYDITDDVMAEIEKSRPVPTPAPAAASGPAAAPAPAPAPPSDSGPAPAPAPAPSN